ncbi:MAG: hypothetical protein A3J38_10795 [Gammaproteobacteria bacterium RIFCSPHIGHO2_12_FULL_45_9]|nr:MAG: hypothetical protein A3J38_10795 [Gammaproteobacteria bacterium RIFCSPHIGHO2_12_FULL_45_9]
MKIIFVVEDESGPRKLLIRSLVNTAQAPNTTIHTEDLLENYYTTGKHAALERVSQLASEASDQTTMILTFKDANEAFDMLTSIPDPEQHTYHFFLDNDLYDNQYDVYMEGSQLAKHIRLYERAHGLPASDIIVISDCSTTGSRERFEAAGAEWHDHHPHLPKSPTKATLKRLASWPSTSNSEPSTPPNSRTSTPATISDCRDSPAKLDSRAQTPALSLFSPTHTASLDDMSDSPKITI